MQAERCRHHDADVGGSRVKSDSLSEVGQIRENYYYYIIDHHLNLYSVLVHSGHLSSY